MNYLLLEETADNGGGNTLLIYGIIVIALFAVMFISQFFSNKKRNQKMNEMMNSLAPGMEVKTIGGMLGKIVSVNSETGVLVINVGTDDAPTNITIDKMAVYTVSQNNPEPQSEEKKEEKAE